MPQSNVFNPICPICRRLTTYNGTLKSRAKQYRCRRHKPNWTCTDSDRPAYRLGGKLPTSTTNAERVKKYYFKNKEKCNEKSKERSKNYYLKNKEKCKEYFKEYYLKNREKYKELFKKRYAKHKRKKQ
jgi:hypothetical protein